MPEQVLTVLYDEDCGLCVRLGDWLSGRPGLSVQPIGSASGEWLLRDLAPARRYDSVHVVDDHGRRHSGADGLAPLLRALPGAAWTAPLVESLPRPVGWGYELVTRHRHTLSRLLRLDGANSCARPESARADPGRAKDP